MNNTTTINPTITESARPGLFTLTFSNSKKHGLRPIQTHHCQGVLYASGHIHLDTQDLRVVHFASLSQMCEYLEQFGYFKVSWENET